MPVRERASLSSSRTGGAGDAVIGARGQRAEGKGKGKGGAKGRAKLLHYILYVYDTHRNKMDCFAKTCQPDIHPYGFTIAPASSLITPRCYCTPLDSLPRLPCMGDEADRRFESRGGRGGEPIAVVHTKLAQATSETSTSPDPRRALNDGGSLYIHPPLAPPARLDQKSLDLLLDLLDLAAEFSSLVGGDAEVKWGDGGGGGTG